MAARTSTRAVDISTWPARLSTKWVRERGGEFRKLAEVNAVKNIDAS
jgi:hypothetical protein